MLTLSTLSYTHANGAVLFNGLNLTINTGDNVALVGHNGSGKSTLLRIMAGLLQPTTGAVANTTPPFYVPQHVAQFNHLTIAQALQSEAKQKALHAILNGETTEENLTVLNDDWLLEERCQEALQHWQLDDIDLNRHMASLSGGQKTKVFLAAIRINQPQLVLLDEPSNHLDTGAREQLYSFINTTPSTVIVVSHDRTLLNLVDAVYELSRQSLTLYGGNYDFYREQKTVEENALNNEVKSAEKALRKARETEREAMERKKKLDARGKKKQEKAGLPTILMNTLRNNAEKSTARIKETHAEKTESLAGTLQQLRRELPAPDTMKLYLNDAALHRGKILVTAEAINTGYADKLLWSEPLTFTITSGERVALRGANGAGKTTLIRMIRGTLQPRQGAMVRAEARTVYIDQDYSLVDNALTVYEQARQFNTTDLQEHELKIRLNRFLFTKDYWDSPCSTLSGGEKMRMMLCCLTIQQSAPDVIILDEPTNNLDLQNIAILTAAIRDYMGTLIVVSHDAHFLTEVGITREITIR